ncbi:hypothetical protein CBG25_19670, partial [Arsenophonus sp. ENCA]
ISKDLANKLDKINIAQEVGAATDKVISQKACVDNFAKKSSTESITASELNAIDSNIDSLVNVGGSMSVSKGYSLGYAIQQDRGFIRNNKLVATMYFPDKNGIFALVSDIPKMMADANGFLKRASPIVKIYPDGSFETNDESEGVNVQRTGVGKYFISAVVGYNADGAWGVNGGVSIPKNINGLELIYVKDKILSNGSIEIQTFHRQHAHLPKDFQNWRIKNFNDNNPVYYTDGQPCDIPSSTWLDVRVQMPAHSQWY